MDNFDIKSHNHIPDIESIALASFTSIFARNVLANSQIKNTLQVL